MHYSTIGRLFALGTVLLALALTAAARAQTRWDTRPDTWVATDPLGRATPLHPAVPAPRSNRAVGLFYFLWMGEHGQPGPFDISRILAQDPAAADKPESPLWGPRDAFHWWGRPMFGYYLSSDSYVFRKHAQMLADAGVDAVIFDVTNGFPYLENALTLLRAFDDYRKAGGNPPRIAFLCPFGNPAPVVQALYDGLYGKGLYPELWYRWEGKPLLLADPRILPPETADILRETFTFRKPQPSYFAGPTSPGEWGWLEVYPQHVFTSPTGAPEQMTVGVAQNAVDGRLGALSNPRAHGRSFSKGRQPGPEGQDFTGKNAQEQWARAQEADPPFVFITGWNEWVAMRFGADAPFHGAGPVTFVDQFDREYSRDIEPMQGGHTDAYYYQMVEHIRRYKGARPPEIAGPEKTIAVEGVADDWANVSPEFRDDRDDAPDRDHPGWGAAPRMVNRTGRNDFHTLKVARDATHVYFMAQTTHPITGRDAGHWMQLYLDLDQNAATGWLGYDVAINRAAPGATLATVERWRGGAWVPVAVAALAQRDHVLELAVYRSALGLPNDGRALRFDFKWMDNCDAASDVLNLYRDGDTAPNGRFNYRYQTPLSQTTQTVAERPAGLPAPR